MKPIYILSFVFVFLFNNSLQGQRRNSRQDIFGGGFLLGVNISQMDGDLFTGFDKTGVYAGVRGTVNFTSRFSLNMELLYSQKGSKIPHGAYVTDNEVRDRIIGLNYIETPFLFKLHLNPLVTSPFLEFGGSFSKLIKTNIKEKDPGNFKGTAFKNIVKDFRTFDYNVIAGVGFNANERLEFTFRYSLGIYKFYVNKDLTPRVAYSTRPKEVEFLRNYYMSLAVAYHLL